MGSFLKAITATIQEEDVDLVVLELRKRSFPDLGALKLIKLIRSLPCPVLLDPPLARPPYEPKKPLLWLEHAFHVMTREIQNAAFRAASSKA